MANPYENYEATRAEQARARRRGLIQYNYTLRLAVIVMCQQAARNYFLRVAGATGTKISGEQDGES